MEIKIAVILLFLTCGLLVAQSQEGSFKLSGMVVDLSTEQPLVGASVILSSRNSGEMLGGTAADSKGNFTLEKISESKVRAKFSMVGYRTFVIDSVALDQSSRIGIIKLTPTAIEMPEVVVKAMKPMIELHADRQVLNVDRMPGNSGTVTEVLRNSGLVDVEPSTNSISVRGQSVKLQMDGHVSNMTGDMLAQMPASMIEQVEVILSPGAKESAEGGTYILNLISKKNKIDNYSGSININTSSNNMSYGGLNLNYKVNKLNFFAQGFGWMGEFKSFNETEQYVYNSPTQYYQKSSGEFKNSGYMGYIRFGMDYDIDDKNSITLYGTYHRNDNEGSSVQNSLVNNNQNILQYYYNSANNSEYKSNSFMITGFYKRKFEKRGNELTLDIMYSDQNNPTENKLNLNYSNKIDRPHLQNSSSESSSKFFVLRTDYALPFKTDRLEAGYNFTYRNKDNDYNVNDFLYSSMQWGDSLKLSNLFKYEEKIHALYLTYSSKIENFDIKGGLRAENLNTFGNQVTQGIEFTNSFLSLFPNFNIAYKFSDMLQLGFTAFRRVTYPQVYYINPFRRYISPNYYRAGNPELKPSYLTSFALNLSQYINLFYTNSTGNFTYATATENDTVVVSNYINLNSTKTYGFHLTLPYNNTPMSPIHLPDFINMFRIQFRYLATEQNGQYLNEDLSLINKNYTLQANLGLKLWFDINANVSLYYYPKTENRLKVANERTSLNLYFSKTMLDRKLRFSLSISDLLNRQKSDSQTIGSNVYSRNIFIPQNSRNISLGISYMINDYKERRDRNLDDGRDGANQGGGQ